ncbi:RadB family lipoprotein [Fusobacterium animalis]|uniref:RadB family lipoprotein n=1 Tax=Fusobacterium animalis TaxID=76859 RepID=UPI001C6DFD92|nr:RadB family lipoprotein [Fusobacterium animalis]QYR64518.1 hypothetical protein JY398_05210 [Fusobacterium animalis]
MKKGIFAMFILVASMAMVACTNANATNEGAVGENDAFKVLEKRREYYKEQDKERVETQVQTDTVDEGATITTEDEAKAKEEADKEALKILEKKRKGN